MIYENTVLLLIFSSVSEKSRWIEDRKTYLHYRLLIPSSVCLRRRKNLTTDSQRSVTNLFYELAMDKNQCLALTGVAQLVGHHLRKQKAASLIPGQGTCLGCGFSPWVGSIQQASDQCFSLTLMFLSLFPLPFPLSKNK